MAVNGIIGIKLGMTQIFQDDGTLVGCTVLQAGPCVVVQRRTKDKDGYEAAQLGLVELGRRTRGCKRREQGQGLCGRRETVALPRWRRNARLDVSPRAGRHRRQLVSVASVEEPAFSGPHGEREGDGEKFEGRESGYGRKLAAGAGLGTGTQRDVYFHSQGEVGEVGKLSSEKEKESCPSSML